MSSGIKTVKYRIGKDNLQKFGLDMHNPVFIISAILILVFVIATVVAPKEAKEILDGAKWWSINNFDWLFMLSGNIFVIFYIALIFLPVGKIRIGGDGAKTEFTTFAWFSMLFAAGTNNFGTNTGNEQEYRLNINFGYYF